MKNIILGLALASFLAAPVFSADCCADKDKAACSAKEKVSAKATCNAKSACAVKKAALTAAAHQLKGATFLVRLQS